MIGLITPAASCKTDNLKIIKVSLRGWFRPTGPLCGVRGWRSVGKKRLLSDAVPKAPDCLSRPYRLVLLRYLERFIVRRIAG